MPKPKTAYNQNNSVASIALNDTVVTLNSTVYRLNGYTTATAPVQGGNKLPTNYTNSTKPRTVYAEA